VDAVPKSDREIIAPLHSQLSEAGADHCASPGDHLDRSRKPSRRACLSDECKPLRSCAQSFSGLAHSALGNAAYVVVVANSYGLRAHMEFTGSYGVLGKKLPLLGSFGRLNGTNLGGGGR